MAEQLMDTEEAYTEHQFMCSECHQLFNTLEDVLIHQQVHTGQEVEGEIQATTVQGVPEDGHVQQFQCLECGSLFVDPEELLQHQEMHMQEAGMEVQQHELCEVLEANELVSEAQILENVKYQCLDCLAMFYSPEMWLEHRKSHSRSSTHSNTEVTEYVLQADGTITPLNSTQNFVLSEKQAGEILAQVLAQQKQPPQKNHQSPSKSVLLSHASLLPPVTPAPGSATMHLQILTAQALADSSSFPFQRRAGLLSSLGGASPSKLGVVDGGGQQLQRATEVVVVHPYECSECSLLFHTPEDFLQHQGVHFQAQDKESGEPCVLEELRPRDEVAEATEGFRLQRPADGKAAAAAQCAKPQKCELCQRTFTSVNRMAAHRRVHEQGTFECDECGRMFKKATSLQTHMRTHSGVARYLCVDCGSGFTTEMTLIMHRKSHTTDPFHKCHFCSRTFTNMTKYLYHRRSHLNHDTSQTPPPASVVSCPRRASPTTLAILQRAREKAQSRMLPPLTEEELERMGEGSTASSPRKEGGGEEDEQVEASGREMAPPGGNDHRDDGLQAAVTSDPQDGGGESGLNHLAEAAAETSATATATAPPPPSERRFVCGVCGKSFKKHVHVRNHMRTHTGERPFQCADCGKTFPSLANLGRHSLTHSGERPHRCDICHRRFSQASNLRQHRLLHGAAAEAPHCCPDCPAAFRRAAKLAAHRFVRHPGAPPPFTCVRCGAGFLTRRQRDTHSLEQHPEEAGVGETTPTTPELTAVPDPATRGSLDCGVCGKRLNSAANLRLHRLSRCCSSAANAGAGIPALRLKAHQCPLCGKLFASPSGVALHQRVHTDERPFPCQVCGKRFRQNTHLREHLRTHSGERPFRCEACGKRFIQSMHLAEHRRTHTGERPHACPLCGKTFKTFSNLRNHKKTHVRQQRLDQEAAAAAAQDATQVVAMETGTAVAVVDASAVELANGQPQLIQIQTTDLQQAQGTNTIMCNEFGETIAIIATSEGEELPLEQALEIYQTAMENSMAAERLQLL
ncbi:uncharacterized protein znf526 isoform X2 [Nelusetta ayraudi]|uniref:uncharacterized protein znf526 isoform X2 n=1 Tax=Nelusetta ayraudi TaxID=303726 RepID=UPI003F7167F6